MTPRDEHVAALEELRIALEDRDGPRFDRAVAAVRDAVGFTSKSPSSLAPRTQADSGPLTLRPADVLRVFHPPFGHIEGRGMSGERATRIPLPSSAVPTTGILLGTARSAFGRADRTVEVRISDESRLHHTYIVGKTGSGKTNLLKLMARQDIVAGKGVAVIDPHGDLVEYLLGHVGGREDEVTLLDFGDPHHTPVLNPLDLDVTTPADLALAIEEFIQILVHQSYHEFYGPRFEDIVRLTLESITRPEYPWHPSVLDFIRIIRNEDRRKWLRELLRDADLVERWRIFEQMKRDEIGEVLHWALSKFSEMARDGVLSQVISGGPSTVSISECVRSGGILLVRIPEWEVSASAAAFLGSFVQERVRRATYGRWSTIANKEEAAPFVLYVDEFQTFATSGFEEIVAEARKFGLGLVLANQNLRQLSAFSRFSGSRSSLLQEAVLGNVANIVVLGIGGNDSRVLSAELGVEAEAFRRIGMYSALVRARVRGEETPTFTLDIPAAESDRGLPAARDAVRRRMVDSGEWRARAAISGEVAAREEEMAEQTRPRSFVSPSASGVAPTRPAERRTGEIFVEEWRQKLESLERKGDSASSKREGAERAQKVRAPTASRGRVSKQRDSSAGAKRSRAAKAGSSVGSESTAKSGKQGIEGPVARPPTDVPDASTRRKRQR